MLCLPRERALLPLFALLTNGRMRALASVSRKKLLVSLRNFFLQRKSPMLIKRTSRHVRYSAAIRVKGRHARVCPRDLIALTTECGLDCCCWVLEGPWPATG